MIALLVGQPRYQEKAKKHITGKEMTKLLSFLLDSQLEPHFWVRARPHLTWSLNCTHFCYVQGRPSSTSLADEGQAAPREGFKRSQAMHWMLGQCTNSESWQDDRLLRQEGFLQSSQSFAWTFPWRPPALMGSPACDLSYLQSGAAHGAGNQLNWEICECKIHFPIFHIASNEPSSSPQIPGTSPC